jgi:hypothetical protein
MTIELVKDVGNQLTEMARILYESGCLLPEALRALKKRYIECVLKDCCGNKLQTARMLCVHRNTLERDLKQLHIDYRQFKTSSAKDVYRRHWGQIKLLKNQPKRTWPSSFPETTPGDSVRKGGRGESPEPPPAGDDRSSGTNSLKPVGGEKLPGLDLPDLECGGLTS